jgi:hypothetical protein
VLFKPRATYRDQFAQAEAECGKVQERLNQDYLRGLEGLNARLTKAGDLDGVLDVRKEQRRFLAAKAVGGDDVVLAPEPLAAIQRAYIKRQGELDQDRRLRFARLGKSYLDELERLKQAMTQIGNIETALEVKREQETVRSQVDLTPLAPPAPAGAGPGPAAAATNAPAPAKREEPSSVVVTQQALKPPRGYIWVFATRGGFPAKQIRILFEASASGKITENATDSAGKINFRVDEGTPYRILVLEEGYELQEIAEAAAGTSYWFKLGPAPAGTGVVELKRDDWVTVPEIGRLAWRGNWSNSENQSGPVLRAADGGVRFQQEGWSQQNDMLAVMPGKEATVTKGDAKYQVKLRPLGRSGRYLLVYKKLS